MKPVLLICFVNAGSHLCLGLLKTKHGSLGDHLNRLVDDKPKRTCAQILSPDLLSSTLSAAITLSTLFFQLVFYREKHLTELADSAMLSNVIFLVRLPIHLSLLYFCFYILQRPFCASVSLFLSAVCLFLRCGQILSLSHRFLISFICVFSLKYFFSLIAFLLCHVVFFSVSHTCLLWGVFFLTLSVSFSLSFFF